MKIHKLIPKAPTRPFTRNKEWGEYASKGGPHTSLPSLLPGVSQLFPLENKQGCPITSAYRLEHALAPVTDDYPYKDGLWRMGDTEEECLFFGVIVWHEVAPYAMYGNLIRVWDWKGGIWKGFIKDDGTMGEMGRRMRMSPPKPTLWGPRPNGKFAPNQHHDSN